MLRHHGAEIRLVYPCVLGDKLDLCAGRDEQVGHKRMWMSTSKQRLHAFVAQEITKWIVVCLYANVRVSKNVSLWCVIGIKTNVGVQQNEL